MFLDLDVDKRFKYFSPGLPPAEFLRPSLVGMLAWITDPFSLTTLFPFDCLPRLSHRETLLGDFFFPGTPQLLSLPLRAAPLMLPPRSTCHTPDVSFASRVLVLPPLRRMTF